MHIYGDANTSKDVLFCGNQIPMLDALQRYGKSVRAKGHDNLSKLIVTLPISKIRVNSILSKESVVRYRPNLFPFYYYLIGDGPYPKNVPTVDL